jgi:hypothetical protein
MTAWTTEGRNVFEYDWKSREWNDTNLELKDYLASKYF